MKENIKALLYCTKAKKYNDLLVHNKDFNTFFLNGLKAFYHDDINRFKHLEILNGTIPCECDFEVEEIIANDVNLYDEYGIKYTTKNGYSDIDNSFEALLNNSCLNAFELNDYLGGDKGYAIHIKNLHIFYKPKELSDYCKFDEDGALIPITKAPQNMMTAVEHLGEPMYVENHYIGLDDYFENYVLISIRPEWLCKILNGEKTIEVRKKVLKEMH